MNYWHQFLQALIVMLIFSHFGFSMERQPRKSMLNADASEFFPRVISRASSQPQQFQSIQNPSHQSQSQPNQQITNQDVGENEGLPNLPDHLFDWEINDEIDDDNRQEKGEEDNGQGTHLTPKLSEGKNRDQVGGIKADPVDKEVISTVGSISETSLTTLHHMNMDDSIYQKHQQNVLGAKEKSLLDKVGTLGKEISGGIEGEIGEKSEKIHGVKSPTRMSSDAEFEHKIAESQMKSQKQQKEPEEGEDSTKNNTNKLSRRQRRRENKQKQNAAKEKLKNEIFGDHEKGAGATIPKTLETTFKETLLSKTATGSKSQQTSSSLYKNRKIKLKNLQQNEKQSHNPSGGGNSPLADSKGISPSSQSSTYHKHQSSRIEGITSRTMKETPKDASPAITVKNTADGVAIYDLLPRPKPEEDNRFDPLETDQNQKQKELLSNKEEEEKEEKINAEHKKQLETNNQQGSRKSAKSKGKSAIINIKEEIKKWQNEKEKQEEKKMLREEIKNAAKQRWEQEQERKQALDNMIAFNKKKAAGELGNIDAQLPTPSIDTTKLNVLYGHEKGGGSGTSSFEHTKREHSKVVPPELDAVQIQTELLVTKIEAERHKKYNQIKKILNNLEEKIKEIGEFEKELREQKENNQKPEKINEIQLKMKKPLIYLWTAYNTVLTILNEHWNQFELKQPYNNISSIFYTTMSVFDRDGKHIQVKFNQTLELTLKKMLMHRNIYKKLNLIINGILVQEKLNCFDELSERIKWLAVERKKNEFTEDIIKHLDKFDKEKLNKIVKNLEIFGKFFKDELNKIIHEAFHFIMVGMEKLPDVWDQMVLEGISKLIGWLPKNRKRQFTEIYLELYEYYEVEKKILKWLSKEKNDKLAERIFDLSDEEYVEKKLNIQSQKIKKLYDSINSSEDFSNDVKNFMLNAFDNITNWNQSINMILKIEKRQKEAFEKGENDRKPLQYLKNFYKKYWYFLCSERFSIYLMIVFQYHFYREKNQTQKAKKIMERNVELGLDISAEIKKNFDTIKRIQSSILDKMMKIIEAINEVVEVNTIVERGIIFESDTDFMNSVSEESPNKSQYNYRKEKSISNEENDEEDEEEDEEK